MRCLCRPDGSDQSSPRRGTAFRTGFPGLFPAKLETGCSAAGLESFVPFLLVRWICTVGVPIALVLDPVTGLRGQQSPKGRRAVLAVTGQDRLEVKPLIPGASDGMAGGVGIF